MYELSREHSRELLSTLHEVEIAVVGDVMLDRYFWGTVSRVSPEAPVPVVDVDDESYHLGGAANVAANLLGLGARALLCGVVGNDTSGTMLKAIAREAGLSDDGFVTDTARPTTVKTRVIGNNQQIVRLDRETRSDVGSDIVRAVINVLSARPALKGIILEDYNKGFLTREMISSVITMARERNIPVFVDPKKHNIDAYVGAYLIKPNRKEAQELLGSVLTTVDDVHQAGVTLRERLQADNVLITLGSEGMMLFEADGLISSVPTVAKRVADVSGAGDTAIATLAAMVAAGAHVREAAALANVAAGVVVAEPGIVSITAQTLLDAVVNDVEVQR